MAELKRPLTMRESPDRPIERSSEGRPEPEPPHHRGQAVRLAEEMAVIAEIGRVIGSSLNIDEVYEGFASEVRKLIPFDRLVINVRLSDDSDAFTIAHVVGLDHPERSKGHVRSAEGTVSGEVFRRRTGLLIQPDKTPEAIAHTVSRFPNMIKGFQSGFLSMMSIPLLYRDKTIGALHFRTKQVKSYTEQDLRLAERIGAQIAGAVANARLFSELKRAEEEQRKNRETAERLAEEMAVIAEIGRIISSNLDIDEVYERFASEVRKYISFDRIHVNLHDPGNESFTIAYVYGAEFAQRQSGDKVSMAGTISEAVARARSGLFLHPSSEEEIRSRFPNPAVAAIFLDGIRSIMCVPLISHGEVIGNLHFRSRERNAFDEHALRLAERIGAQIAGAIVNARLFSDLKQAEEEQRKNRETAERLAEEMAVIAEIGRVTGSSLEIGQVYETLATETNKLIRFDRLSIMSILPDRNVITVAYVSGCDIPRRRPGDTAPLKGTLSEIVLRTGKSLLINTKDAAEMTARFPDVSVLGTVGAGMRSIMCVPLISRGVIIGILHLWSRTFNAYTECELLRAERIGPQIAGAIANAGLFGDLKRAEEEQRKNRARAERLAEEMALIARIGRIIGSNLDIDEVYERFAAEVRKLIPFDRIHVNLHDPDGDSFIIAYVSGSEIAGRMPGDKVPMAGTISEAVAKTRVGLCLHPASEEDILARFPSSAATTSFRAGMRSMMCVPLISHGEVIGNLHFRSRARNAFDEHTLRLAERIAVQIAGAIANAQLFKNLKKAEAEQRKNRQTAERLAGEMAIIAEIGRVIGSSLDINQVYERFTAEAKKLIPFDRIALNVINADAGTISFAYISGIDIHQWTPGDTVPIKGSFSEIVMQTRTGLLINTTGVDDLTGRFPGLTNIHGVRSGIRSLITVPLISGGEVVAVLNFRSMTHGAYGEPELIMAERIGSQIAGAIANAQLFSRLKRAEEALRSSEQRLMSYIEGAGDAIYVLSRDTGRILDCNSRACQDLGYGRDELLALSATDIEAARSSGEIDVVHGALKPGEVKTIEGLFRRKDGSVFPVEIRLSPLSPAQPELLISIVRDITERRRAQKELERYRTHLEQMVKARTEELETKNITLQELNTTLKVLLKQRDEDRRDMEERFVMNVKNLVLPFVEQMKKGRLDGGQQDCLEIVETHLNDIATPLLKSIRQFNLTPREIKVAALVRDGKSTKDIASILGIAKGSIDIHRNSIRRKLGLGSRKVNLQSYLETLDQ